MRLTAIIGLVLMTCASAAVAQETRPSGGRGAMVPRPWQGRIAKIVTLTLIERPQMRGSEVREGFAVLRMRLTREIPNVSIAPTRIESDVVVFELTGGSADRAIQKLKELSAKPWMSAEEIRKRLDEIDAELGKNSIETSVYDAINSSRAQLWPGILMEQIKDSELQKRRLEMDLAAKEVRVKLLTRQIKQIEEEANKKIEADPVLAQLKRVVDLRKQAMDRSKRLAEQHATSQEDISKAEEQLLEAEIRVAERMETLRQNTKADLLNRLSSDLATLMIDMAEMNAKLSLINKELPQIDLAKLDEKKLDQLYEQYKSYFLAPQQQTVRDRLRARREQLLAEKMRLLIKDVEVVPEDAAR